MNPRPFPYARGTCGRGGRDCLPAPPYNPTDYWATRRWVSRLVRDADSRIDVLGARLDALSVRTDGLASRIDDVDRRTRPLSGHAPFALDVNGDLYYALSEIIPLLGGRITAGV